jgi:hypothetical protein
VHGRILAHAASDRYRGPYQEEVVHVRSINPMLLIPVVGLVMLMWGWAKRIQPLIWFGLAAILALPALGVIDYVLHEM